MITSTRVVFDCNTFLQALASPNRPAGRCVQLAIDGKIELFLSPTVLEELHEVASRPKVIAKLQLTPARTQEFIEVIEVTGTVFGGVSGTVRLPTGPERRTLRESGGGSQRETDRVARQGPA